MLLIPGISVGFSKQPQLPWGLELQQWPWFSSTLAQRFICGFCYRIRHWPVTWLQAENNNSSSLVCPDQISSLVHSSPVPTKGTALATCTEAQALLRAGRSSESASWAGLLRRAKWPRRFFDWRSVRWAVLQHSEPMVVIFTELFPFLVYSTNPQQREKLQCVLQVWILLPSSNVRKCHVLI